MDFIKILNLQRGSAFKTLKGPLLGVQIRSIFNFQLQLDSRLTFDCWRRIKRCLRYPKRRLRVQSQRRDQTPTLYWI